MTAYFYLVQGMDFWDILNLILLKNLNLKIIIKNVFIKICFPSLANKKHRALKSMQRRQVKTQLKPISRWLMGVEKENWWHTLVSHSLRKKVEVKCWLFLFIHIWIIKYWINMRKQRLNICLLNFDSNLFSMCLKHADASWVRNLCPINKLQISKTISWNEFFMRIWRGARVNKSRYEFHHFDNHQNILLICNVKSKKEKDRWGVFKW